MIHREPVMPSNTMKRLVSRGDQMDRDSQVRFRNAAAGLIKSLIRARARQEPDILSRDKFRRWGVPDAESETHSCAQLLNRVRQLRDRFERLFLANQDSIPAPGFAQEAEVFDCLVDRVSTHGTAEVGYLASALVDALSYSSCMTSSTR
jgi:hypothetical protein